MYPQVQGSNNKPIIIGFSVLALLVVGGRIKLCNCNGAG